MRLPPRSTKVRIARLKRFHWPPVGSALAQSNAVIKIHQVAAE